MQDFSLHIVIPAYGISPFLEETLISTIPLVSENVSITVIDDGSTSDAVQNICKKFSHVDYLKNSVNQGISKVFKQAFDISDTTFIVVCGSDDCFLPNYVDQLTEALNQFPNLDAFQPNVEVINQEGQQNSNLVDFIKLLIRGKIQLRRNLNPEQFLTRLAFGQWLYFPAIAWRKETIKNLDWSESFSTAIDLYLLFNFGWLKKQMVESSKIGFQYRRHSESVSSKLKLNSIRINEELRVHNIAYQKISNPKYLKFILMLAVTSRIHGLIMGLKNIYVNPKNALKILSTSLKPISYFKNPVDFRKL